MAENIGFGKQEMELLSNDRLPLDVQVARIEFKNRIRKGGPGSLRIFANHGFVLPSTAAGQRYYEFQVGEARMPTAEFRTLHGSRRLVALVDAGGNILKMYFTEDHYIIGSWMELQYP